jgi:hypothetical protein
MKRYRLRWLFVVLALAVLAQTGCQQRVKAPDIAKADVVTEPQKARTAEVSPKITFDKTTYDFGEVSPSAKYTGQFKFTNTGSGVLKITEVKKCCGAVVTLDKQELSPGESGTLKVEYSTGSGSGLVSRQLRVNSNDETNAEVALTIKARVVPKVNYQPQRINLVLNKENAGCPAITITSLDKKPFSIKSFQSTGETITADVDPAVEATRFVLEPKVDLEKLKKRSTGFITISLTHPELDRVTILFSMLQRFKTTPGSIILVNPEPLQPAVQKIIVASNYGEQFEIESASSEKGLAKVLSQQAIANGYRLEVEITPPARDATSGFTDMLNIQLKDGEKLSIKCYGRYVDTEK